MRPADITTIRPRLEPGVEPRRTPDGRLVLVGRRASAYMDVRTDEEPLLALLDGQRDLDTLVADALELKNPVRPLEALAFLRRLSRQRLLAGLGEAEEHLFGHSHGGPLRMVAKLADLSLLLPGLSAITLPGRLVPRRLWPFLHVLAVALLASALVYALWLGRVRLLLDPFAGFAQPFRELALIYLAVAATLSFRALYRGLLLQSLGLRVPRAGLRVLAGIVHLEIDDRERRAASREDRLLIATGGLSALVLYAGLAAWGYILNVHWTLRFVAPSTVVALLVCLAPYLHTDLAEVVAIRFRIPQLRHRSLSYVLHRAGRNLLSGRALSPRERRYLAVSLLCVVHGVASVHVLASYLAPGALDVASTIIAGQGAQVGDPSGGLVAVGLFLAGILVFGLATLVFGLVVLAMAVLIQLARPQRAHQPVGSRDPTPDERAAFTEQARSVPFFSSLSDAGIAALVDRAHTETFGNGQVVVRQGDRGDRFYFIESGRCAVEIEEISGRHHQVALLGAGDFFGEIALVRDVPRTATVIAAGEAELLALDRDDFQAVLNDLDIEPGEVLSQVRNGGFLRQVPALSHLTSSGMCKLLAAITEVHVEAGAPVVIEGDPADAMYIIREGQLVVERGEEGQASEIATLGPTDVFGELGLMNDAPRNATVRARDAAVVLRVPAAVFHDVLMTNFVAAVTLDHGCAARLDALQQA